MRNAVVWLSCLLLICGCAGTNPSPARGPHELPAVAFIRSLVNPTTGLVSSRQGECFSTIYKNALAAMVFLHEGDRAAAEGILDVFNAYMYTMGPIGGVPFPKDWDACTGTPTNTNYWEGDNAFLLLALNYYDRSTANVQRYAALSEQLVSWMVGRAGVCSGIVAEGVANMYAALKPHDGDAAVMAALDQLRSCYFSKGATSSVAYPYVLDHTVRGTLIFGDQSGFDFLPNFRRTESWIVNGETVEAYSAFSADEFINVEISAQLLLTGAIEGRTGLMPGLQENLEKLWIPAGDAEGLPYFLTNIGFDQSATLPIIDPTAYMLFYYWKFNPFSPGKQCADCVE